MADDPTELVTIKQTDGTEATKEVPRGALHRGHFPGWVELDATGRKKAQQSTTTSKEI